MTEITPEQSYEAYLELYKINLIQQIADELGVDYPELPWDEEDE